MQSYRKAGVVVGDEPSGVFRLETRGGPLAAFVLDILGYVASFLMLALLSTMVCKQEPQMYYVPVGVHLIWHQFFWICEYFIFRNEYHGDVEEKFEKYFGYFARCEAKCCTTTLKINIFHQNDVKMQTKCRQNFKIDL